MTNIPQHIGIIMDGNGRWATKRGLPRNLGHKQGIKAIEKTVIACKKLNIKYCSFFAFSTENWKRSKEEIDGIFSLLRDYLKKENNVFIENKIKVETIGTLNKFPKDLYNAILDIKEKTKSYKDTCVIFALNYGGRDDIIRAVNKLIKEGYQEINEKLLLENLDTKNIPEPDLVIRTSGEMRISNFMLYQMAYSELYFPKLYWPSFNEKSLKKCIEIFQKRNRRFGGLN